MLGPPEKFVPPYALGVAGKIPAPVDLGGAPNVGPVLDRPLARLGAANLCSSSRGSGAAVATFLPCAAVAVVAAFSPRIVLSFAARARAATSFRSRATEPARTSRAAVVDCCSDPMAQPPSGLQRLGNFRCGRKGKNGGGSTCAGGFGRAEARQIGPGSSGSTIPVAESPMTRTTGDEPAISARAPSPSRPLTRRRPPTVRQLITLDNLN